MLPYRPLNQHAGDDATLHMVRAYVTEEFTAGRTNVPWLPRCMLLQQLTVRHVSIVPGCGDRFCSCNSNQSDIHAPKLLFQHAHRAQAVAEGKAREQQRRLSRTPTRFR